MQEVGSEAVSRSEFAATTAATADLTPSLLVDGEPTSSATATVAVTAKVDGKTVLGRVTARVRLLAE